MEAVPSILGCFITHSLRLGFSSSNYASQRSLHKSRLGFPQPSTLRRVCPRAQTWEMPPGNPSPSHGPRSSHVYLVWQGSPHEGQSIRPRSSFVAPALPFRPPPQPLTLQGNFQVLLIYSELRLDRLPKSPGMEIPPPPWPTSPHHLELNSDHFHDSQLA